MEIVDEIYCPNCKASIKSSDIIYDYEMGEQVCGKCAAVIGEQRNNDFFTYDSFLDIYRSINDTTLVEERGSYMMGHESKTYGTRGSGLTGAGSNIITSYTTAMDFSSVGIMSSVMDKKNVDFMGNKIKDTKTINRMRYINNITTTANNKNPNEKNAKQVILLIKQISQKKNFPQHIQEDTVNLYRKISDKNNKKRLQYKITAYWCLYYTLRSGDLTPSLPEFLSCLVDLGFIEEDRKTSIQKKVNKVQIFILDLMEMNPIPHSNFISNIVFLCNKYELDEIIKRQCLELGHLISSYGCNQIYQGRSPKTIAAMLIAIIMLKEGLSDECGKLLKELKITSMVLRKILQEIITHIEKHQDNKPDDVQKLKELLSIL